MEHLFHFEGGKVRRAAAAELWGEAAPRVRGANRREDLANDEPQKCGGKPPRRWRGNPRDGAAAALRTFPPFHVS